LLGTDQIRRELTEGGTIRRGCAGVSHQPAGCGPHRRRYRGLYSRAPAHNERARETGSLSAEALIDAVW
jgi:hypothetical protein